jgi:hypothetical protein
MSCGVPAEYVMRRTNGVSLGPHISASQVKKSDSEIGPAGHRGRAGGDERK